ncbi:hypothetical protein LC593_30090 [Nostoc sp. CHAB 5844]|nr:hypothetical protein [Nostoc sp. CHAB 5844]
MKEYIRQEPELGIEFVARGEAARSWGFPHERLPLATLKSVTQRADE